MFRDLVWSEVGPISCVALLWFGHEAILFYAFWKDLTLIPLALLLLRPSSLPPVTKSISHFLFLLAINLFYALEFVFLLLLKFNPQLLPFQVVKCSWEHNHILDSALGLRELVPQKWNYLLLLVNFCLLMALTTLPERINSAAPQISSALVALGKETIDSLFILVTIVALAWAGCSWPSALHSPYFFAALLCSMGWAANATWLSRTTFRCVLAAVRGYVFLHLATIALFHNNFVYQNLQPLPLLTDLLGLKNMRDWTCVEQEKTVGEPHFAILVSLLAVHVNVAWCQKRMKGEELIELPLFENHHGPSEGKLLNKELYEKIKKEIKGNPLKSSAISLVVRAKEERLRKERKIDNSTELQDLLFGTIMNSTMMVWSVLFHSWLGLVMLLMANVMWLIPRQSVLMKLMVRFVSFYTSFRLVMTYLTSFTFDYPPKFFGFDTHQFGLKYTTDSQQVSLLLQCLFTAICLIVYRQYTKPYISGLNIPLSGFKRWVKVVSLFWVRYAVLLVIIMVIYDVQNFKIVLAPFYLSVAIALWIPRRPGVPLTVFFSMMVIIAEIKLMLTYVYNFTGSAAWFSNFFGINEEEIYVAYGLHKMKGAALLLHLWLPNLLSMFSAIFLTALKTETKENLERNWRIWEHTMKEFVLVSATQRHSRAKRRSTVSQMARPHQVTFATAELESQDHEPKIKSD